MQVLVTGGAGYIGSHAVQRLLAGGHDVTVIDNLSRGNRSAIDRLAERHDPSGDRLRFVEADVGDRPIVDAVLRDAKPDAVLHFAALAYVGESVHQPLRYWRANTSASIELLDACLDAGVERFIFSSTCASYGEPSPERIPIGEDCPQHPINPYGRSKLAFERALFDAGEAQKLTGKAFACAALRYFNVAGSDRTGLIGESHDPETHLIPILLQVALGQRERVTVFGTDYDTPDGTCVRDYVHVEDLIDAHLAVLGKLEAGDVRTYNLGIGKGSSVREMIEATRRVTGHAIPTEDGPRREGDPPTLFADPSKIEREIGWRASITDLDEIIESAWRWFREHPRGYAS
ncbi:MAG: UDP-glucose 4-epimerase GalE [Phycisphaerales bacterium]|nr:MAG: UDP-glucose 4-epimerase GalE [Phycisphaerales bacterium]